jgi:CheY-like chemotaxis protein
MQKGPVYIIDDDTDEHELIRDIWKDMKIPNEIIFFKGGDEVLRHLEKASNAPFIIICDVNLPKMNGFELREKILESGSKKYKSVPFIFWSTRASEAQITQAFELSAHGFFIKESSIEEIKQCFQLILNYWQKSEMPAKNQTD